jgi:hypothetical protein
MKGTPRSLWLSMANRMIGTWTGFATAAIKRQQRTLISEAVKSATGKKPKKSTRRRSRSR